MTCLTGPFEQAINSFLEAVSPSLTRTSSKDLSNMGLWPLGLNILRNTFKSIQPLHTFQFFLDSCFQFQYFQGNTDGFAIGNYKMFLYIECSMPDLWSLGIWCFIAEVKNVQHSLQNRAHLQVHECIPRTCGFFPYTLTPHSLGHESCQ